MRELLLLSFFASCLTIGCYSAGQGTLKRTGENRIVYKPASEALNDSASALLKELVTSKNYTTNPLIRRNILCGPYLWKKIKNMETFQNAKGAQVKGFSDGIMLESKVLWDEKVRSLLEYCFSELDESSLIIRKLNESEIRVYWAYISFDIEEPIFMIEAGKKKYVVDFATDTLGLFWFDDFSTLGIDHSEFDHKVIEPISELSLPVGIFDLSLELGRDLPDSVFILLPFLSGNLFFTDRPSSNVLELMVSKNNRIRIPLDSTIFEGKTGPDSKNGLFDQLGLRISPEGTKFGRFGSFCGRFDKGKMDDFGEMIMFWDDTKREGFLLCYFDRPCKVEGYMTQQNIVVDIEVQKPGFYCIGNEKLADGKTLMKEIDPPSEAFYFVGIAKERQKW